MYPSNQPQPTSPIPSQPGGCKVKMRAHHLPRRKPHRDGSWKLMAGRRSCWDKIMFIAVAGRKMTQFKKKELFHKS